MPNFKKTTDYKLVKIFKYEDPDRFHSKVRQVTKKHVGKKIANAKLPQKYKSIWYLKTSDSTDEALHEVIAQEVFRLIIPNQPKTRLVENSHKVKKHVASKAVDGYQPIDAERRAVVNAKIKNGTYHGLGEVLVVALLVNEVDLRLVNLCLNSQNQIIKIDGDRTFASFLSAESFAVFADRNYDITANDVQQLPFIDDYEPWNWLDLINEGKREWSTKMIDVDMTHLPMLRYEINRALMKLLVLPDQILSIVIDAVSPNRNDTTIYYDSLIARREKLKIAALKNADFCAYMQTETAVDDLNNYLQYLTDFKTTGKNNLGIELHALDMRERFNAVVVDITEQSLPTIYKLSKYIGSMFSQNMPSPMDVEKEPVTRDIHHYSKW